MKECDNRTRKIHISSNFILSVSLLIMFDTLLLRPSLHFNTPLHFTTLHPTKNCHHHYNHHHYVAITTDLGHLLTHSIRAHPEVPLLHPQFLLPYGVRSIIILGNLSRGILLIFHIKFLL
jgi:hypothetical protein